jgi:hypothetical protein
MEDFRTSIRFAKKSNRKHFYETTYQNPGSEKGNDRQISLQNAPQLKSQPRVRQRARSDDDRLRRRAQNKTRALSAEHLVRSHALDPEPNASIRNLDLFRRGRSYLVCYDRVSVCERMSD